MVDEKRRLPYLRLVEANVSAKPEIEAQVGKSSTQTSMFSDASIETLGFIAVSKMAAAVFQKLIEDIKPKYIFDIRQVPSLSDGTLTRKTVFAMFEAVGTRYFDVAGIIKTRTARDAALNPSLLVPNITQNILGSERPVTGPVLFFVDDEQMNESFISGVSRLLPGIKDKGWEVCTWDDQVGGDAESHARNLVFISHANPEDNEIAKWFAVRLAAEGFDVWSDITRLVGGEHFWTSIEEVIRAQAASVVVLLSNDGHEKPGVLDEVNVAVATERQRSLKNFVIPVRIDNLPFSQIRANLARKNVIDAASGLAPALAALVEALDSAKVPRRVTSTPSALQTWRQSRERTVSPAHDQSQWNVLVENRADIVEMPPSVFVYDSEVGKITAEARARTRQQVTLAFAPGGTGMFASPADLMELHGGPVQALAERTTDQLMSQFAENPFDPDNVAMKRTLVNLVHQAWEQKCRARGLKLFKSDDWKKVWFVPGGKSKTEVRFADRTGKTLRRQLAGVSEAKKVQWHFAVEAIASFPDGCIRLRPHVVFTEDGQTPIPSAAKQHSLRRGFCRSWWNDRWRDLLSAMLAHIAEGHPHISLDVSPSQSIKVLAKLTEREVGGVDDIAGVRLLTEPDVEVGFGQRSDDPREGLLLFGPTVFERNPSEIRVGVVATPEGVDLFERWCERFQKPTMSGSRGQRDIPFLGFEATFGARWPRKPTVTRVLSRTDILNAIRMRDRHQAVHSTVSQFVEQIRQATVDDDAQVDIWFIVIPDDVYLYGRPLSRVPTAISIAPQSPLNRKIVARFAGNAPSLFDEDNAAVRVYEHHADFHHQLKARLLQSRAVTQVFRESSIRHILSPPSSSEQSDADGVEDDIVDGMGRRMQDGASVAWNLATASFFKAGGRPWRVATARPGVCYVGLIFKRDDLRSKGNACCGAQLFLDSGEGIVFKGSMGPWYSPEKRAFHLSGEEACRLMEKSIEAYREVHKTYPTELFVHGRTRFSAEELEGFAAGAKSKSSVTGVRITRSSEYKLFSTGEMAVKRGTRLVLNPKLGLLWTSGYVERLQTYQGRETPNPLRVEICGDSSAPLDTVLTDILSLTKMNFNSAVYADGFPVTMRFADAIGDVLMANEDRDVPPLPFKHYI
ncbi:MAG: TIR domain-containing protein [Verrucomicrobiaceae bacterium]|nr:MAG: TIR domain-containing protein [Verrucomicrobiaceae bacterium]